MKALLAVVFCVAAASAQRPRILYSVHVPAVELAPDPAAPVWRDAEPVLMTADTLGRPASRYRTEIRSRWDDDNLHILFVSAYQYLNLNADPYPAIKNRRLNQWDYAEIMIGSDFEDISKYVEFGISPTGEWYDNQRWKPESRGGQYAWYSGCKVQSRLDKAANVWYSEIRIPLRSIDSRAPRAGNAFRVNFFRSQFTAPKQTLLMAWQPTGAADNFNVPSVFGTLILK